MTAQPLSIAANNGSIGGGEVMLLNIAEALRELDRPVTVVAPTGSGGMSELADEARRRGFAVTGLPASSRSEWMRKLRAWDRRERRGVLWCNGLVAAAATAGHRDRIVHLHQRPQSRAQQLLYWAAKIRALRVLVPSADMRAIMPGTFALGNWCEASPLGQIQRPSPSTPVKLGFLGRLSMDKGIGTLTEALSLLDERSPGGYRLALAGSSKFVDAESTDAAEHALREVEHLVDRLGWVSRDELLAGIDLLAVPSRAPESFGLVAAEAMVARVPVIVSDAGALPEVVGPRGKVVPASDPAALATAIEHAAEHWVDTVVRTHELRDRWAAEYSPTAGRARVAALLADLGC
ncbi:glycosyltransferase involved in cell wall biosynthesis [Leucobacter exalbidus]|uniref:Glycosyltransferase involved in cell wall biosynthesis n=1 Tax=Leucobacter exalbidus TaxID=662960 RepID=A0A940PT01_9MICO|nr:glycosyltransferase family 4 protein [Leucobacter exalbidus]MBP1326233.1 glycosyltransferase involved in cell wall biosynthesis [Leucobacter exalbidus]